MSKATTSQKSVQSDPHTCKIPGSQSVTVSTLRQALLADPDDQRTALALVDAWQEDGIDADSARIYVARISRWARCQRLLTDDGARGRRLRSELRRRCGVRSTPSIAIKLVGDERHQQEPVMTGEAPYHTFRNGGVCQYPGAARRAGYRTEYHPDTREITVGVKWLDEFAVTFFKRKAVSRG